MSRIYKKTNFAGSDSLMGIAFGGGGGGRESRGGRVRYKSKTSNIAKAVGRSKKKTGSRDNDRKNRCVSEHVVSVSTGPGYGVHVKKGRYEASVGAAAKIGVEAKYNAKNGFSSQEFAKVEFEGKVKSPKGELSAGKVGIEVKHDGKIKNTSERPDLRIGKNKGSVNSRNDIEIGGHVGVIGVNYKYSCR